jgi:hypothetical protein
MSATAIVKETVSLRRIYTTWWPLAGSWLLMAIELPALSAIVARLPEPEINLAAYSGIVFSLALIIESPIIMLLAASTALSKDWASYQKIRQYMMGAGALLTALHLLIALTPLYYVIVEDIIGAPPEIVEPARIGLIIMTPWTWSIAYRRFNQGVLIRFGHSQTVVVGTAVRLSANLLVLLTTYWIGSIPGIIVATSAVAMGVMSEALYVGIAVRPVIKDQVKTAPPVSPALTWRAFYAFYIPLVMTSLLPLLVNPIGSAALSRMPDSLDSLAVWPVIVGLVFMLRSLGIAYNEVVVALLDEPGSSPNLKRFAQLLAAASSGAILLVAMTPLSDLWFGRVTALSTGLVEMAQRGLWLMLPLPALSVAQSWYQGAILHSKKTRGISESVVVYLLTSLIVLSAGVMWGQATGLYIGLAAFTLSMISQTAWLWWRSAAIRRQVQLRDG